MYRVHFWESKDDIFDPLVQDIDAESYTSDSEGTHFYRSGQRIGSLRTEDFWWIEEVTQ